MQAPEQKPESSAFNMPMNKQQMLKGFRYFILFTILGLAGVFIYTSSDDTFNALKHLQTRFFLIAIGLSALDLFIGGWRNHIFVRKIKPGVSPWLCFRANLANLFMGSITPSQSGGGPAQLFVLYRGGIPLASGISVSVINFLATLIFFPFAAGFSLVVLRENFSQKVILYLIQYGFLVFSGLFLFFVFALWRPDLLGRIVSFIAKKAGDTGTRLGKKFEKFAMWGVSELDRYHQACTLFLRKEPLLLIYSFVLTIIMYLNKFTLAYFLVRGLGITQAYASVIAIQTLLLFILYFAPSPGGSGIAEVSTGALMATLMPTHLLPLFTLLYRFFLLYMPAALGAIVLVQVLNPVKKPSDRPLAEAVEKV
ncbi:MAG: UPF0104 family protein [Calditrichaeota bacterium]|nr:MAG: UPF0104 family protein [Calditrichota bacterium]